MNIKHILLGTAAALVVATGAQAADLPGEAVPTAVDYVKVCDAFGAGFFYIPGTETCLDISGRVRTGVAFTFPEGGDDSIEWFANGRVDFDARTASEYGMLRSFFRVQTQSDGDAGIGQAYIQLGYLTFGYTDDFMDSFGGLYGDTDRNNFASTQLLASVMVDDLGGGFYAGLQVLATESQALSAVYEDGSDDDLEVQGIIGISDQPWGSAALAVAYDEALYAKLGAEFVITDPFSVALQVAYDGDAEDVFAGIGAQYEITDALTGYANFGYTFADVGDDAFGATLGADYTVTKGLVLTTEVTYDDDGADETFGGLIRLNRTW